MLTILGYVVAFYLVGMAISFIGGCIAGFLASLR